jgi:hypothetical protein
MSENNNEKTSVIDRVRNLFSGSASSIIEQLTDESELGHTTLKIISLVCMLIAVGLSYGEYSGIITKSYFSVYKTTTKVAADIRPDTITVMLSIAFMMSFIIRNHVKMSIYNCILYILNILFCASFMSVFFSKDAWSIPFVNVSSQTFLLVGVLTSWLCIRSFAGIVWIILFVVAINRMTEVNIALGSHGVIYIISAFISMLGQMKTTDMDFISAFKSDFFAAGQRVAGDMSAGADSIKNGVKSAVQMGAAVAAGGLTAVAVKGATQVLAEAEDAKKAAQADS